MNTNKKILSMGVILLLAGITAATISFAPSRILQYLFVLTSLTVGIFGILIGKNTKGISIRSSYYSWTGVVMVGLSVAVMLWANSLPALINALGFFLLILSFVEFVFALQILNYETPIPWKAVGLKLTLSATSAIGAASILTMAGFHGYMALLVLGLLFITVGLTFIEISRVTKETDSSVSS